MVSDSLYSSRTTGVCPYALLHHSTVTRHCRFPVGSPSIARFSLELSRWSLHKSMIFVCWPVSLYLLDLDPFIKLSSAAGLVICNLDVTGRVFGVFGELVHAYREVVGNWSHGCAALASLELCGRDRLDFRIDCSRFCSLVSVVIILSDNKKRRFSYYLPGCWRHHCLAY